MYNDLKTELALLLGISKDALHIHLGLALFVALILILRRSPGSIVPWLGVLAAETANELIDIFHWYGGSLSFEIGDSPKDFVNTMLWPTVVTIAFRITAARRVGQQRRVEDSG